MSDFGHYAGADEEHENVKKLSAEADSDPDNFEKWEALIRACESLEGGLTRNSSPQALLTFRESYDRFLHKFPLLFGYWKKYAEKEFNIAGPESAEMVYERGVAHITNSVDLWTDYCAFKMETTHDPDIVRELFERGARHVGLDFLAHPFWDKYLEYEQRQDAEDRVYEIVARVIRIPMHQYARYYERFRVLLHTQKLTMAVPADVLARFQAEVQAEAAAHGSTERPEEEVEQDIRTKVDALFYEVFTSISTEVTKRWTYESELKRPYFHITELEHPQLNAWRKYLDFEESEGDFERVTFLYERCLVTTALYDEFWFRYARWMSAQAGKEEEVRHIYMRAAFFVPISRPAIRLQWAFFEESCGRVDVALDIYAAILQKLPECVEVIDSWAHAARRQCGVDAAIQVYQDQIEAPTVDLFTKAAIIAEWAMLLWKSKRSAEEARAMFVKNAQWYADSRVFWDNWFQFELEQPSEVGKESEQGERMKHVFDELRSRSRLSAAAKRDLSRLYLNYLMQRGGKDSMKTFMQVDRELFGPTSVMATSKGSDVAGENGTSKGELDDASKAKAEMRFLKFYEGNMEPVANAQGPADFN